MHCATIEGGSGALAARDARERLRFVDTELRRSARRMRVWAWGWAGAYSALATQAFIRAPLESDPNLSHIGYFAGASSLLGVAVLAAMPQPVMRDQRWLEQRLHLARPDEDPCALLADAERLLVRDVKRIRFGKSALVWAGGLIFNVALGMVVAFGFTNLEQAALIGILGTAVGVIQSVTMPAGLEGALERYRAGRLSPAERRRPPPWSIAPHVSPGGYGLSFAVGF